MAQASLFIPRQMRRRETRTCTYVVLLDGDVQSLARYLSTLALANCEVIVADPSPAEPFEEHRRVLRWVSRHVACAASPRGDVDLVQLAVDLAGCEKVIIAPADARFSIAEVQSMCALLDRHDVVEPEEYFEPLPWWGALDAGRLLLDRGIEDSPRSRATFAFRKSAFHPMFVEPSFDNRAQRFSRHGVEIHEARDVFVRREPAPFASWLRERPRQASVDLAKPLRSAFFFALLPLLIAVLILGGKQIAEGYAGVIAFAAVAVALRGRIGATKFYPLHVCLFAPLWIAERSISIYWALFARMSGLPGYQVSRLPGSIQRNVATR